MKNPEIIITIKDLGDIKAELYPEKAPLTVANFLSLAKKGFFEGLVFHRVIEGFMIQGGGFDTSFKQKAASSIKGEFASNGCRSNDIKHKRGTLSMARTNMPNSASSQFFIMHGDAPYLDGQYAAFGLVTEGMDVVDKIASVKTVSKGFYDDVPKTPVIIEKVTVIDD